MTDTIQSLKTPNPQSRIPLSLSAKSPKMNRLLLLILAGMKKPENA